MTRATKLGRDALITCRPAAGVAKGRSSNRNQSLAVRLVGLRRRALETIPNQKNPGAHSTVIEVLFLCVQWAVNAFLVAALEVLPPTVIPPSLFRRVNWTARKCWSLWESRGCVNGAESEQVVLLLYSEI
ncbi:hypothetical protein NDU88_006626 [Pleurodeles waltl]|uniref:Uncharacterized protein n=1 Tax=Pleurodeles waltl TaxID=8319 RepID=A0AAV7MEF3_PLEWA|nr:hypothetical protein NDU88_006626 [Pleurodeles waltl]